MPTITGTISNILGAKLDGEVSLASAYHRVTDGALVLADWDTVPLIDSKFTADAKAGPARLRVTAGSVFAEWDVSIPDSGPVEIAQLINDHIDYPEPIILAAQAAALRAEKAAKDSQSSALRAEQSATRLGSAEKIVGWVKTTGDNATAAAASATAAKTSETNAASSKTAAAASATAAKTSETNAASSKTAAANSATAAAGFATAASTSATAADGSKTAAASSATAAKTSETAAKTSENNAASSAASAQSSASASLMQADRSKTEADRAATSAQQAADTAATGVPDATTTAKGKVRLAGDLSGTADAPTVPRLTDIDSKLSQLGSGTILGQNVDLNTLTNPGNYHQGSIAYAKTGTNYPTATAGWLRVYSPSASHIYQQYMTYGSTNTRLFARSYDNGTWGTWQELSQSTHTHTSAQVTDSVVPTSPASSSHANRLIKLDSTGKLLADDTPTYGRQATSKTYVDTQTNLRLLATEVESGDLPSPSKVPRRTNTGQLQTSADPSLPNDLARKSYVDSKTIDTDLLYGLKLGTGMIAWAETAPRSSSWGSAIIGLEKNGKYNHPNAYVSNYLVASAPGSWQIDVTGSRGSGSGTMKCICLRGGSEIDLFTWTETGSVSKTATVTLQQGDQIALRWVASSSSNYFNYRVTITKL